MNKIKEDLRLKLQGQLSDEKTQLDVDNAYEIVKETVLSFSSFLRKNCAYDEENEVYSIKDNKDYTEKYVVDAIFYLWGKELI